MLAVPFVLFPLIVFVLVRLTLRRMAAARADAKAASSDAGRAGEEGAALLMVFFFSLFAAFILPTYSATVRSLLSPVSCVESETLDVLAEGDMEDPTEFTLYCRAPDGGQHFYGCGTSWVASYDLSLLLGYLLAIGVLAVRRSQRAHR